MEFIGEHPLATDGQGRLKCRIATIFPQQRVMVTQSGIHATQRMLYQDRVDQQRAAGGKPPLTRLECHELWENAVDLIIEGRVILIRPDPERMALAYAADDAMQRDRVAPKTHIRFLNVLNAQVREAIKRRGECWRISRLPHSVRDMEYMIQGAKMAIGGREIYYYNRATGSRYLTCYEFGRLGELDDDQLRQHLFEILDLGERVNDMGNPEVELFQADAGFRADLFSCELEELPPTELRTTYLRLRERFRESVTAPYRTDNMSNVDWRSRMYASLLPPHEDEMSEEELLGLSAEFYMQVQWLPGAHIVEGELIFDSVFDSAEADPDTGPNACCDDAARGLIRNLLREYGDLEYVNIGCITDSLNRLRQRVGRRGVYLIEMKLQDRPEELLKIVRLQKWGVAERLDQGLDLLQAMLDTEEYREYILDRRLACRQLGMSLATRVASRQLREIYRGRQAAYQGRPIWTPYYERDYVRGMATDKIPLARFEDPAFAERFAFLLGQTAAPNAIVGRADESKQLRFDDGDEVLIEDENSSPIEIIVADFTGAFVDYETDLPTLAAEHAQPILRRWRVVADPKAFASAYRGAFISKYVHIRAEYARRQRAFDTLFREQSVDPAGNFAFRWQQILKRLRETDVRDVDQALRKALQLPPRHPKPTAR